MKAQSEAIGLKQTGILSINPIQLISILILVMGQMVVCDASQTEHKRIALAEKLRHALGPQLLEIWYPLAVDSAHGGYLSDFSYSWEPDGKQEKMIVTQARHVWTASKASQFFAKGESYEQVAAHGVAFLRDVMWDRTHGGFFNLVDREGQVLLNEEGKVLKRAYGNAFAIFGLAAYVQATSDPEALALAQEAFRWLEEHSYDQKFGGYFQFLEQDGTALQQAYLGTPPKDQNSTIHLLEAYTELYRVWPDPLLRKRADLFDELLCSGFESVINETNGIQI